MAYIGKKPTDVPLTSADIGDETIDSDAYVDGSIDNAHIADNAIDSEHYADGSIDNAHIADDAIDSEHYAAGSIDEAHIADNAVTLAKMAGNTDGVIITFNASGDPVAVGPGSDGQVLTSTGAGSPPAFESAAGGGGITTQVIETTYNLASANGTVDYTGAGFDPIGVHMQLSQGGSEGAVSFGWVDSDNDQHCTRSDHYATNGIWAGGSGHIGQIYVSGGNVLATATLITDGIRISWAKASSPTGVAGLFFFCMK